MEHIKPSYFHWYESLYSLSQTIRSHQFPVWFTPHLRHLIKCLRTLQRKYTKHPTTNNFQRLVSVQCSFQDASRAAKSAYEQCLIQNYARNHDPKIYISIHQTVHKVLCLTSTATLGG